MREAKNTDNPLPTVCSDDCQLHMNAADPMMCAEQKRRREGEMQALYDIARVLSERSGQHETLTEILKVLEDRLNMKRGTVMLLDGEKTELFVAATANHARGNANASYKPGEGVTGYVMTTGQSIIVPSIANEPRFCDRIHDRSAESLEDVSFICVPITVGSTPVGTLAVDITEETLKFLDEAERCLTIVASMIGYDVRSRRMKQEQAQALQDENLRLRDALEEKFRPENIVGNSRLMREVYVKIKRVAASDTTVLIRGETGTGKELIATAIHYASARANGPFVRVNCAQLSEHLLESELFGHEVGAFTGAINQRVGRIEEAQGGTLFLDEIGEFYPSLQVKILRVLQEREFERVGSNESIKANVRIIAATNRDLEAAVASSHMRQDFYYRINVFPIVLPPLRERRDDILLLANHFAQTYARQMDKQIKRISTPAINAMMSYHWPGNVRELENCIEHAVLLADDGVICAHNLPPTLEMPEAPGQSQTGTFEAQVDALERDLISDSLKTCKGNAAAAARQLGITPRIIRYKIKKLDIDLDSFSYPVSK
jgi:Nif-specific regulatory protein